MRPNRGRMDPAVRSLYMGHYQATLRVVSRSSCTIDGIVGIALSKSDPVRSAKSLIKGWFQVFGITPMRRFPFVRRARPFIGRRPISDYLGRRLAARVDLMATEGPVPEGELFKIWSSRPGAHKWYHYFSTYEEVISPYKNRPIALLEIGINMGASLNMWREYLHKDSTVVGIDIAPECARFEDVPSKLYCRIGDQSDPDFLQEVIDEFGPFDIILDDGSHLVSHMIASFNHLFPAGLKDPGVYLVEDTHSNFWTTYRDQEYSFVDFARDLVDLMHEHYAATNSELDFRLKHPQRKRRISVSVATRDIEEIRFKDSLVILFKRARSGLPISSLL